MREYRDQGFNDHVISSMTGYSQQWISKKRKSFFIPPVPQVDLDREDMVFGLYEKGIPMQSIAKIIGLKNGYRSVWNILDRGGRKWKNWQKIKGRLMRKAMKSPLAIL